VSVEIETKDNVTTISFRNWSVPLHFKDGEFDHYGIPTRYGETNYTVSNLFYYVENKLTFTHPTVTINQDTKEKCPSVDIGVMNKDGSAGDYATVWVSKNGFKVRGSVVNK
jgi:hypothetical protein